MYYGRDNSHVIETEQTGKKKKKNYARVIKWK